MSQGDSNEKTPSAGPSDALNEASGPARSCPYKSHWKLGVVVLVAVMVALVLAAKHQGAPAPEAMPAAAASVPDATLAANTGLPRLLELGSVSCIPCQMMAPILAELRQEYAGKLQVDFIDVKEHPEAVDAFRVRAIPTQIFFEPSGNEVFRHEGFFPKEDILAEWKNLSVDLKAKEPAAFERLQPAQADSRPKDAVCYMCDGDISPKTLVVVRTDKGDVRLCSPHCYFIMYFVPDRGQGGVREEGLRRRTTPRAGRSPQRMPCTWRAWTRRAAGRGYGPSRTGPRPRERRRPRAAAS